MTKKRKTPSDEPTDPSLILLAKAAINSLETHREDEEELDSMDSYAYKLRSHFYADKKKFLHNFIEGYLLLLEEIHEGQDKQDRAR